MEQLQVFLRVLTVPFGSPRNRPANPICSWRFDRRARQKLAGGTIETITADEENAVWLLNDSGLLLRARDARPPVIPGGASPTRKLQLAAQ
jgi:hypothetical protein